MYEVVVGGRAERTVRLALAELVEDWRTEPGHLVICIGDQSALVAVINRLHEMGVVVEQVRSRSERPRHHRTPGPDSGT